MYLWFLICALSVIQPCLSVCTFCTPTLTEFYTKLGCKTNCRRNQCITGYDCRIPLSKRGKECYYLGKTYEIDEEVVVQISPTEEQIFACTLIGANKIFIGLEKDTLSGPSSPVDNMLIDLYSSSALTTRFPVIRTDSYTFRYFRDQDLPPATCTGGVHCCKINQKLYEWNTEFTILNFNCKCSCSPFAVCVPK